MELFVRALPVADHRADRCDTESGESRQTIDEVGGGKWSTPCQSAGDQTGRGFAKYSSWLASLSVESTPRRVGCSLGDSGCLECSGVCHSNVTAVSVDHSWFVWHCSVEVLASGKTLFDK